MLAGIIVASRKINEGFALGRGAEIQLKVVEIRCGHVLIGIEGPEETLVELDPPAPSDPGSPGRLDPNKEYLGYSNSSENRINLTKTQKNPAGLGSTRRGLSLTR